MIVIAQACLLALGLTPEEIAENNMTPAGWCVMVISITSVLALLFFSLYTTLSLPPVEEVSEAELARTTIDPDKDL
ncbi:hypothetical protein [Allorhodopirellula heiligendammensis]|uniref:Uncharacterized protein n=1 Tax=Allorhodopirellula heiligendammensis TaxID=2714739 RepID=A0A5C6BFV0_9BACT|nr:hypothetical protein [Allorhodopirellula heiligendammensis]TWU11023.1 hypothetical protein Poly21_49300 [Allorhodopirellula heiligendammensis]|tara:strand:- start:415 stop:642 length:228 start_codon:yes stop_codon:yes gene_type:complete